MNPRVHPPETLAANASAMTHQLDKGSVLILLASAAALVMIAVYYRQNLMLSLHELYSYQMHKLRRHLHQAEQVIKKKEQQMQLLKANYTALETKIQDEVKTPAANEEPADWRSQAFKEMSEDVALGMMSYLNELEQICASLVQESKSPKYRLPRIKTLAARAASHSAKIKEVTGFLQRAEDTKMTFVNASEILKECLRLCHDKVVRNNVELEIDSYEPELWLEGRPSHIVQGFLGLLYNALEAIEFSDVRRVSVRLKKVHDAWGKWVELSVTNSGAGVPTQIKVTAFHSKRRENLASHSLGLSMAFGVFESYGGSLRLDSESIATTMVARLPYAAREAEGTTTNATSIRLVS